MAARTNPMSLTVIIIVIIFPLVFLRWARRPAFSAISDLTQAMAAALKQQSLQFAWPLPILLAIRPRWHLLDKLLAAILSSSGVIGCVVWLSVYTDSGRSECAIGAFGATQWIALSAMTIACCHIFVDTGRWMPESTLKWWYLGGTALLGPDVVYPVFLCHLRHRELQPLMTSVKRRTAGEFFVTYIAMAMVSTMPWIIAVYEDWNAGKLHRGVIEELGTEACLCRSAIAVMIVIVATTASFLPTLWQHDDFLVMWAKRIGLLAALQVNVGATLGMILAFRELQPRCTYIRSNATALCIDENVGSSLLTHNEIGSGLSDASFSSHSHGVKKID